MQTFLCLKKNGEKALTHPQSKLLILTQKITAILQAKHAWMKFQFGTCLTVKGHIFYIPEKRTQHYQQLPSK